jgi:hypothetical protein
MDEEESRFDKVNSKELGEEPHLEYPEKSEPQPVFRARLRKGYWFQIVEEFILSEANYARVRGNLPKNWRTSLRAAIRIARANVVIRLDEKSRPYLMRADWIA